MTLRGYTLSFLLDLGMPRRNGYDACRLIRQHAWGDRICLIALSGWGQREDHERTRAAGFDYHLVKPVEIAALARLIEALPSRITT